MQLLQEGAKLLYPASSPFEVCWKNELTRFLQGILLYVCMVTVIPSGEKLVRLHALSGHPMAKEQQSILKEGHVKQELAIHSLIHKTWEVAGAQ